MSYASLHADVAAEIESLLGVDASRIAVGITNGLITLDGSVPRVEMGS